MTAEIVEFPNSKVRKYKHKGEKWTLKDVAEGVLKDETLWLQTVFAVAGAWAAESANLNAEDDGERLTMDDGVDDIPGSIRKFALDILEDKDNKEYIENMETFCAIGNFAWEYIKHKCSIEKDDGDDGGETVKIA